VARSEQTCAAGAAMFAAVVGGIYANVEDAQKAMGKGFEKEYLPDPARAVKYEDIYQKYLNLGEFTEKML
jgi:L-ribulokinase